MPKANTYKAARDIVTFQGSERDFLRLGDVQAMTYRLVNLV
jgi:hypothetical protein